MAICWDLTESTEVERGSVGNGRPFIPSCSPMLPETEACNLYGWAWYRPSSPHSRSLSGSTRRTSSSEGFRPPTIMTPSI